MHSRLVIFTVLAFFAVYVVATEPHLSEELTRKADDLVQLRCQPDIKPLIDSLLPSEIAALSAYFRIRINERHSEFTQRDALEVAVELGDDLVIAQEAEKYANDTWNNKGMFYTSQPKVVEAVSKYLFLNEAFKTFGGDAVQVPLSYDTAMGIRGLLANSPYFTPAVNEWAKSWAIFAGTPRLRGAMRKWWVANQRFFAARNYSAVLPGDPPPKLPGLEPIPEPAATPITSPIPAPQSEATAMPTATAADAAITPPLTSPGLVRWNALTFLAIAAVAILAVFVAWRTRR